MSLQMLSRWWARRSLRSRLTLFYTSFFAFALLALGIVTYLVVANIVLGAAQEEARVAGDLLVRNYAASNQGVEEFFSGDQLIALLNTPDIAAVSTPALFAQVELFSTPGSTNVIAISPNLRQAELPIPPLALAQLQSGKAYDSIQMVQGGRVISHLAPLRFESRIVGFVQVARPLADADRALRGLVSVLLIGSMVTLGTAALSGVVVAGAALQPLTAIATTARSIMGARDLNQRVPLSPQRDEVAALTGTINDLLARLERVFQTQQQFVADVSHELRTPLAAMRGNLEVLQRGAGSNPAILKESLADMRGEVGRMTRLVNDLLLLAQTEAGVELRQDWFELDTLLLEVYREWKPLAEGVRLEIELEDQATIYGDRDRIKQAVLNLVANALQHTPVGGQVRLRLRHEPGWVQVMVEDTGNGIPAMALPHLFDRFFRADPARSRPGGGAGLGLSISKWITETHAGTITVTSEEGHGSTFTITLPESSADTSDGVTTRTVNEAHV